MFPDKDCHFCYDEEVSVSQDERIAQNQSNLYEIIMDHNNSNYQFVYALKFTLNHQQ